MFVALFQLTLKVTVITVLSLAIRLSHKCVVSYQFFWSPLSLWTLSPNGPVVGFMIKKNVWILVRFHAFWYILARIN